MTDYQILCHFPNKIFGNVMLVEFKQKTHTFELNKKYQGAPIDVRFIYSPVYKTGEELICIMRKSLLL